MSPTLRAKRVICFLESETDVVRFTAIFEHLRALALPPEASVSLITSVAREL